MNNEIIDSTVPKKRVRKYIPSHFKVVEYIEAPWIKWESTGKGNFLRLFGVLLVEDINTYLFNVKNNEFDLPPSYKHKNQSNLERLFVVDAQVSMPYIPYFYLLKEKWENEFVDSGKCGVVVRIVDGVDKGYILGTKDDYKNYVKYLLEELDGKEKKCG